MEYDYTVIAVITLFFLFFIALIIHSCRKDSKKEAQRKISLEKDENLQNAFLANNPYIHKDVEMIVPDHAWEHSLLICKKNYIIADANDRMLYINQTAYPFERIRGGEYITSTTATTTQQSGGVGRALVGGLVGGAAGAIVGASTASKTSETKITTDIKGVRVLVADIAHPSVEIKSVDKDSCERFLELIRYVVDDNARYQNSTSH